MTDFVAYIRVSTARQGRSGLGLAAQRQRIEDFIGSNASSSEVVEWFEEQESGSKSNRPELENALTLCELTGSTLLIATLDRLSRDVLFMETVKRRCDAGGFAFRCCDMPDADSFMLGIMAQVAQYERQRISERTRAALQAAKRRGVVLGNPQDARCFKGRQKAGAARAGELAKATADTWAEKRRDLLTELQTAGLSLSAIARELTARGITTRRGGQWHARTVANLIDRLAVPAA
jgi:DNA invertase Pin-like site-specific DNA recombinase